MEVLRLAHRLPAVRHLGNRQGSLPGNRRLVLPQESHRLGTPRPALEILPEMFFHHIAGKIHFHKIHFDHLVDMDHSEGVFITRRVQRR